MTRVTATDGVLLLLREQLERSARRRLAGQETTRARPLNARDRVGALAAAQSLPQDELGRVAVRILLEDRLGTSMAGEPGFESAVREVTRMIADTSEGKALLDAACRQLLDRH